MSTKVKRTPLFGHDGNLGIPIIPRDTKVRAPEMRRTKESWDNMYAELEVAEFWCCVVQVLNITIFAVLYLIVFAGDI